MGSGLFDFKKIQIEFRGKTIAMEIRPMKTKEMAVVLPYFMDLQKYKDKIKIEPTEDGKKQKVKIEDPEAIRGLMGMQEQAKEILKTAVRNLEGIDDDMATIAEEFYYFPLAMDIIMALFSASQIGEADVKNSKEPSSGTSSGTA